MMHTPELEIAVEHIKSHPIFKSKVAIILGSGLGSFADTLNKSVKYQPIRFLIIPYQQLKAMKVN